MGISVDPLDKQKQFAEKENLPYPIIADSEKTLTKAFGSLGQRGYANRDTYVIDKDGAIKKVFRQVSNPAAHSEEVLKYVQENLK